MSSAGPFKITDNGTVRFAEEKDVALIFEFIRGLAEYERMTDEVTATEEGLRKTIFHDKKAEVLICEYDGTPVGFSLFFHNYSTFLGKPGIYIEDLFINPEWRGKGLGKGILKFLAQLTVDRDCGRLEWCCLDWNEPSIQFYLKQGAIPMSGWTTYRLTGDKLKDLADKK
jgi:GNAT superfamily N-acetyltransferase